MRQNQICLNAVSRKIPDSLSEDRLMFSSAGAQPISLKSFRGLGHFPNKIALVYKHEHCLPSASRSWQVMRSGYRRALLDRMASSGVGTHRICLLFSVSHVSKCHFLKWKSAAIAALSAQKRNGRTLSMAAKSFILTIDSVSPTTSSALFPWMY